MHTDTAAAVMLSGRQALPSSSEPGYAIDIWVVCGSGFALNLLPAACCCPACAAGVEDAKLRQYLAWAVRQQQPVSDQDDAQQLAAEEAAKLSRGSTRKRAKSSRSAKASEGRKGQQQLQERGAPTGQRTTRAQARAAEVSCAAASQQSGVSRDAKHCTDAGTKHSKQRRTCRLTS
jgi:hypothetical protein